MALNNVLFLRTAWGYSVLEAGMASALAPVVVAIVSGPAGKLASRVGFRPLLVGGPLLFTAGIIADITLLSSTPDIGRWLAFGVLDGRRHRLHVPRAVLRCRVDVGCATVRRSGVRSMQRLDRSGPCWAWRSSSPSKDQPGTAGDVLDSFRRGWWLVAGAAVASALVSVLQPSRRTIATPDEPALTLIGAD